MLPFLKNKQQAAQPGLIVQTRQPDNPDESLTGLKLAVRALLEAIKADSPDDAEEALKDCFALLDQDDQPTMKETNE